MSLSLHGKSSDGLCERAQAISVTAHTVWTRLMELERNPSMQEAQSPRTVIRGLQLEWLASPHFVQGT